MIFGSSFWVQVVICLPKDGTDYLSLGLLLGKGAGVLQEEVKLCSWSRHLPASVVQFQPALRTWAQPISQEYLKDTLRKWIHM